MDALRMDWLYIPLASTFAIGLLSFLLLAWYSVKKHEYWKNQGVPFVKPYLFVGSLLENIRTPLHDVELQRYFKLGRIYGHFEGNRPVISVGESKLLREILVKDFPTFSSRRAISIGDEVMDRSMTALTGEDWKRIRTIITPTFTTGRIKRMLSIFKDCSRSVVANFKKSAENNEPIDCKKFFSAYTMDVIASSAFSTKLDSHNDPENDFVRTARKFFKQNINWKFILLLIFPSIVKLFKIPVFDAKILGFFKSLIVQIIEERKSTGKTRNDFLQLLLDTTEENAVELNEDEKESADITSNYGEETTRLEGFKITNKKLSMNELIAQCMVFFLAGFETTASTLAFSTYLLALNTEIQDKLRTEVDDVLRETDGELTYEAIQRMKYLDNVISETLRLYPPAIRLERTAEADYELGDTGITIPKGMIVTIPNYAMHRDPKYFPEPEKFEPDRFTVEERLSRDQYCYLPFGAGPRNCVGMRFALMEIKVCLAYVVATFIIKKHSKTAVPLDFHIGQGLLQAKEILLEYEPRKEGSSIK